MNRILLIGVEGLDQLVEDGDLGSYPQLEKMISKATYGVLESKLPQTWESSWVKILSGIDSPKVCSNKYLTSILSKMAVTIALHGNLSENELENPLTPSSILEKTRETLESSLAQKPVDLQDVTIIALKHYFEYLELGGDASKFWHLVNEGLTSLVASMPENTIFILFSPYTQQEASKGIRLGQWLADKGLKAKISKAPGLSTFEISFSQKPKKEDLEALLTEIADLRFYARRGGDLRVFEFADLYDLKAKTENSPDLYLLPKNEKIYLDPDFDENKKNEPSNLDSYKVSTPTVSRSVKGVIYFSGYQIQEEKDLGEISILAVAPTVMDLLRLEPYWEMQEHSIYKRIVESRLVETSEHSGGDAAAAVRSRLEALGY